MFSIRHQRPPVGAKPRPVVDADPVNSPRSVNYHEKTRWTADRDDLLSELWGNNMTATQIADAMGGMSRNAILGRVRRLDLPRRRQR